MGEPFLLPDTTVTGTVPLVALLKEMTKDEVMRFIPMDEIDWAGMLWEETISFELVQRYKIFIEPTLLRAPYIVGDLRAFNTVVPESWYYGFVHFNLFTYELFRPLMDTKRVQLVNNDVVEKYAAELDTSLISTHSMTLSLNSIDKLGDPSRINWNAIYNRFTWGDKSTFWFQRKYIKYDRRLYMHIN